ncbi:MAG TPA: hypothetical protein VEU74_00855 [Gemmatimonadales bacterium]|nr:hypothetical protein [Gemmatimonadales bacterium]
MKDPLAIGLGALMSGVGLGGGTIVAGLAIVRSLEHHAGTAGYEDIAGDPVIAAMFAGLAVAATFGWRRTRALENLWQRGVIGVMSAVGAMLVGFIAWPVDRLLQTPGLIAWAVTSFIVGAAGSAWAVQGSRDDAGKE